MKYSLFQEIWLLFHKIELIQGSNANLSGILANLDNYRLILVASAYNAHQGFVQFISFLFCLLFFYKNTSSYDAVSGHVESLSGSVLKIGRLNCFFEYCAYFHIACLWQIYIRLCSFHFFRHHLTTFTVTHLQDSYHDISRDCVLFSIQYSL